MRAAGRLGGRRPFLDGQRRRCRGVDFRAVGQDGDWALEVTRGAQIVLVTDYGFQRVALPAPAPQSNAGATQTTYSAYAGSHQLSVVADRRPCRDPRSGELFDTTVTVRLDGVVRVGCGRELS